MPSSVLGDLSGRAALATKRFCACGAALPRTAARRCAPCSSEAQTLAQKRYRIRRTGRQLTLGEWRDLQAPAISGDAHV